MSADSKFEDCILEQSFIALVYAIIGWMLLAWWLVLMKAGLRWHLMAMLPALILIFLAIKRSPLYRHGIPAKATANALQQRKPQQRNPGNAGRWSVLVPLATGILLGVLVLGNGTLALSVVAIALTFIPWMRLPSCRSRFGIYCAMACTGHACTVLAGYRAADLMFLPIACWILWLCASWALLRRVEKVIRAGRAMQLADRTHDVEASNS